MITPELEHSLAGNHHHQRLGYRLREGAEGGRKDRPWTKHLGQLVAAKPHAATSTHTDKSEIQVVTMISKSV